MENEELKKVIETLLFVSTKPVSLEKLYEIINLDVTEKDQISKDTLKNVLENLTKKYLDNMYSWQILHVAGGYQFVTKKEFSPWIKILYKSKFTIRLSVSALETLSIIAYKQPITKAEIEQIRGIDSTGVIGTLLNRKLIRISGHKETLGSPALYVTTQEFLRYFGLNTIKELPLPEQIDISEENQNEIQEKFDFSQDNENEYVVIIENKNDNENP